MDTCAVCGSGFQKVRSWQLYCSEACRSLEMNTRKRSDRSVKYCRTCREYLPVEDYEPAHRSCRRCEALTSAGVKKCRGCLLEKPFSDFYARRDRPKALSAFCKECASARSRAWNSQPEIKKRVRDRHLRVRFGISADQFDELLASQGGVCAICREEPDAEINLHVDHDHRCCATDLTCGNCIRGLLCYRCNSALGFLRESPVIAAAAVEYLRRQT